MSRKLGMFPFIVREFGQHHGNVGKKVGQYHGQKEKKLISGKRQALPDFQRQLKSVFPYALSYADFLFYALNQPK